MSNKKLGWVVSFFPFVSKKYLLFGYKLKTRIGNSVFSISELSQVDRGEV